MVDYDPSEADIKRAYETAYRLGCREGAAKELRLLARWLYREAAKDAGSPGFGYGLQVAAQEANRRAKKLREGADG